MTKMTQALKYKNQVCFYEGRYLTFIDLKKSLGSTQEARTYLLPKDKQNALCNIYPEFIGIPYWYGCYILKKVYCVEYPYEYLKCAFPESWKLYTRVSGHKKYIRTIKGTILVAAHKITSREKAILRKNSR